MTITKAIQRIGWRFKTGLQKDNTFSINENDVEALKVIDSYITQTQKQQYESNELFAKLYVFLFRQYLEKYRTTVYDNNVRKSIGEILEKPLPHLIDELRTSLNESELYTILKEAGSTMKHPALKTEQDTQADLKAISNIDTEKLVAAAKNEAWGFETVNTAIMSEVNNMINLHR